MDENELYKHIHNPEVLLQYDSNFIHFKKMPNIQEFNNTHSYLRTYHEKHGQKHVKFYFPEGEKLTPELEDHMKADADFTIGYLELFAIEPANFPAINENLDIKIQRVTSETLDDYLRFQYEQNSIYGNDFAEQKQFQHVSNYKNEKFMQIIGFYKGTPAGSVDVIISEDTAEIDALVVYEDYQRKGIGSQLQKFVMDQFPDKTVILVADGDDTAKDMYRKQNYQYLGFQYESFKVYK
ncbi:GNAT family N-acetyltransferase [Pseudoneobacillus rhizosphaerae]